MLLVSIAALTLQTADALPTTAPVAPQPAEENTPAQDDGEPLAASIRPAPEFCAIRQQHVGDLMAERDALQARLSGGVSQTETNARAAHATMRAARAASWAAGAAAVTGGGFGAGTAVNQATTAAMLAQQANNARTTANIGDTVAVLGDVNRRLISARRAAEEAGCANYAPPGIPGDDSGDEAEGDPHDHG